MNKYIFHESLLINGNLKSGFYKSLQWKWLSCDWAMFSSNCINEIYGKIFVMLIGNGGAIGNVFSSNYLVHVGRYTYISTEHGKDLNDVEQYLQGLTGTGHLLALYYNVSHNILFTNCAGWLEYHHKCYPIW